MGNKCQKCNKTAPLLAGFRGWGRVGGLWFCPTHRIEERKNQEMDLAIKLAAVELTGQHAPGAIKAAINVVMKQGLLHQEALEEARRIVSLAAGAGAGNPKCPNCATVYNRDAVIREIKVKSPEIFDFQVWTTKFKCVNCGTDVPVSGARAE